MMGGYKREAVKEDWLWQVEGQQIKKGGGARLDKRKMKIVWRNVDKIEEERGWK